MAGWSVQTKYSFTKKTSLVLSFCAFFVDADHKTTLEGDHWPHGSYRLEFIFYFHSGSQSQSETFLVCDDMRKIKKSKPAWELGSIGKVFRYIIKKAQTKSFLSTMQRQEK